MAYKRNYKSKSPEEKQKEIDDLTASMDSQIQGYFESEEKIREHLAFMANFHKYSPRNMALINQQFMGASAVGSFNFWKSKGASVNKGEKGIKILVPNPVEFFKRGVDSEGKDIWTPVSKATPQEKQLLEKGVLQKHRRMFYKIGYVFEYTQTNAREKGIAVSEIFGRYHREGTVENDKEFMKAFEKLADKIGVQLLDKPPAGVELGTAKGAFFPDKNVIAMNPRNTMADNVPVMIHELAHAELHNRDRQKERGRELSTNEKEFQAEMVAYVVATHYGIKMDNFSLPYLASWTKDAELKDKEQLLNEVRQTSSEFIEVIDSHLEHSKELSNIMLVEYGSLSEASINEVSLNELKQAVTNRIESYPEDRHEELKQKLEPVYSAEVLTDKEVGLLEKEMGNAFKVFDKAEIEKPTVLIQWSESEKLKNNELMRFGEANEKFAEIGKEQSQEDGYYKTRYHVIFPNEDKLEMINPDRHDIGDGYYKNAYQQMVSEMNLKPEHHNTLLNDIALYAHEKAHGGALNIAEPSMMIHGAMPDFKEFGFVNNADFNKLKFNEVVYTVAIPEGDTLNVFSNSYEKGEYLHPLDQMEKTGIDKDIYDKLQTAWDNELFRDEEAYIHSIAPRIRQELNKEDMEAVKPAATIKEPSGRQHRQTRQLAEELER
ncbi:ArdC-like ssDNA-binding domain-containing protein [Domibacillus sp. A3M-37]|uniref:LPD25 domain-containing protein n=1 Tax=Domibacillus sp. A3M-37 TaxID=2962037 RepID=UPI0020B72F45|nr:LPD25 domain-containing protein [Domibacillus sp. A3M-37]MCP3763744.1 ArdC-like ssDNA-binding domain-containing protein [Domibacillus sp. A3M-37]